MYIDKTKSTKLYIKRLRFSFASEIGDTTNAEIVAFDAEQ